LDRAGFGQNVRYEKPSPDFSDEGLVELGLNGYFLQHLPGQHFVLPWQQSAGDVAVAVPMNAAKVAIKRRYFIRFSFSVSLRKLGHDFQSGRAGDVLGDHTARRWNWRALSERCGAFVANANRPNDVNSCKKRCRLRKIKREACRPCRAARGPKT
jgi:hypothetical protein